MKTFSFRVVPVILLVISFAAFRLGDDPMGYIAIFSAALVTLAGFLIPFAEKSPEPTRAQLFNQKMKLLGKLTKLKEGLPFPLTDGAIEEYLEKEQEILKDILAVEQDMLKAKK